MWQRNRGLIYFRFALLLTLSLLLSTQTIYSATAIQGGENARGTSFVVAIVVRLGDNRAELCSGGLIGQRVIATAAHCVVQKGVKVENDAIVIFPPGQDVSSPLKNKVKGIFTPIGYRNDSSIAEPDDIAFLVLDSPVESQVIDSIANLAVAKQIVSSKAVIRLYGYGITGRQQSASGFPKVIELRPIEQVSLDGFSGKENTYISYAQENTGAACNGDSGGPAVAQFNGKTVLVSVHSASAGVCSEASTVDSNWGTIPGEYPELFQQALTFVAANPPSVPPSPNPSPSPTATPTSAPNPSPSASIKPTVAPKRVTITCIKGKQVKKITAVKPKCPKGYVKKR